MDKFVLFQVFESVGFLNSRLGISSDFASLFSKRAVDLEVNKEFKEIMEFKELAELMV